MEPPLDLRDIIPKSDLNFRYWFSFIVMGIAGWEAFSFYFLVFADPYLLSTLTLFYSPAPIFTYALKKRYTWAGIGTICFGAWIFMLGLVLDFWGANWVFSIDGRLISIPLIDRETLKLFNR